jgi:hypothetical protein
MLSNITLTRATEVGISATTRSTTEVPCSTSPVASVVGRCNKRITTVRAHSSPLLMAEQVHREHIPKKMNDVGSANERALEDTKKTESYAQTTEPIQA